ncbi:MAG: hypothetical protein ABSD11_15625 [Methylocella sp.]|jgi:hypothetical protein
MARRKQPTIFDELLDQLLAGTDPKTAFAKCGLLDELKKALAMQFVHIVRLYDQSPRSGTA